MTESEFSAFKEVDGGAGCFDLTQRIIHLKRLKKSINDNHDGLVDALECDLGKPLAEIYASEIGFVTRDIDHACRHLQSWAKPKYVKVPKIQKPGKAFYQFYPRGAVLVLGAWNYPIQLSLSPLVAALAAGNKIVIKPSEYAPKTASIIRQLCYDAFGENPVHVIEGGAETSEKLINYPFDFIFFTGSNSVGEIVAKAAASNMIPCALELGGKSPCVVHKDADLKTAAKRIMWGKYVNAGQTCIAPDYVLVEESIKSKFLSHLEETYKKFFANIDVNVGNERGYCRIINHHHFDRLAAMISESKDVIGGERNRDNLLFTTAILTNATLNDKIMEEEIFGPILPVIGYDNFEDVYKTIQHLPNPLSAYIFTSDWKVAKKFQDKVMAGSMCINDVLGQATPADLPFGGVNRSGYGRYHGRFGFETFSYSKSVFKKKSGFDFPMKFPPYRELPKNLSNMFSWFLK